MKKIFLLVIAICLLGQVYAQNRIVKTDNGAWAYIVSKEISKEKGKFEEAISLDADFKNRIQNDWVGYYGFSEKLLMLPIHDLLWYSMISIALNKIDTTTLSIKKIKEEGSDKDLWGVFFKAIGEEEAFESYSIYYTNNVGENQELKKTDNFSSVRVLCQSKTDADDLVKDIKRMVRFNAYLRELPDFDRENFLKFSEKDSREGVLKKIEKARSALGKGKNLETMHYKLDLYKCKVLRSWVYEIEEKMNKNNKEDVKKYFDAIQDYKKHIKQFSERYKDWVDKRVEKFDTYFSTGSFYFYYKFTTALDQFKDEPEEYEAFLEKYNSKNRKDEDYAEASKTNAEGFSMLQVALIQKDFEKVKRFVEAGADLYYQNPKNYQTVLDLAFLHANEEVFDMIVSKMIKDDRGTESAKALGNAAWKTHRDAKIENLKIALKYTSHAKISLIHCYKAKDIRFNDKRLQELMNMKNHNADYFTLNDFLEKEYNTKKTPLIYACEKNDMEMVKFLLTKIPPDYNNQRDEKGMTALMTAAKQNNKEIVEYLLEKGFDAKVRNDKTNQTAMDYATDKKLKKILKAKMK